MLRGTSFLGFERGSTAGRRFRAADPKRLVELDPEFVCARPEDVDRAVDLAQAAFTKFGSMDGASRASFLRAIAERLSARASDLIDRASRETGLPAGRIEGEIRRTTGQLELFANLVEEGSWVDARIDVADPDRAPLPKPDLRSMLRPLGPVAVFGASNFPLAFSVAGGDTASALAPGCPVVFKAHPAHPGTCEIAAAAVLEAASGCALPEGVFSLLFDDGHQIGQSLVQHPQICAVAFTGSRAGGRALMDVAAARKEPIPVFAEMGSINPVFILPGAMSERAQEIAHGLHASLTLGMGQFCTNPGLVVALRETATDIFVEALSQKTRSTGSGPMLSAGICANYRARLQSLASQPGVELLTEGRTAEPDSSTQGTAAVYEVDAQNFLKNAELTEEVFGPSTLLVLCADHAEMVEVARALDGQLTATIHAQDHEQKESSDLVATLESRVGRLIYNGFPTGVEVGHAMVHGGPYPATSDGRSSSVGTRAISRFVRPICYQDFPDAALPPALQRANPDRIWRRIDGTWVGPAR
jgi:NADP-dependent aldehyde dehydrogenase